MINTSDMKRRFFRFLKEHDVYYIYFKLVTDNKEKENQEELFAASNGDINSFLNGVHPLDWFVLAFDWELTPQGISFWQNLENEWVCELKKEAEAKMLFNVF